LVLENEPPPKVATLVVELFTKREPVAGVYVVVLGLDPTLVQTAEPSAVTSSSLLRKASPLPRTESAETVAVRLLHSAAV
jgi:hypothetical protein